MHEPLQADLVERPHPGFAGRRDREGSQNARLQDSNGFPWWNLGRVSPDGLYEPFNADPFIQAPERGRAEFYLVVVPAKSLPFIICQAEKEAKD